MPAGMVIHCPLLLDTDYQRAVEQNDTKTMARILANDFILVSGNGTVYTKDDLLKDAASGNTKYEHQVDSDRTVRVSSDTAAVTAKLWVKGLEDGKQVASRRLATSTSRRSCRVS